MARACLGRREEASEGVARACLGRKPGRVSQEGCGQGLSGEEGGSQGG